VGPPIALSFGAVVRVDQKMPGVALLASALSPKTRPRYAMGKDAKLHLLRTAAGED
jgi:hypothetical protein